MSYDKQTWNTGDIISANKLNHMEDGIANGRSGAVGLIEITYSDLKTLRDNANLMAGMQYRITDYICTVANGKMHKLNHIHMILL